MAEDTDRYRLYIQTGQSGTFKQVIDCLKEILVDVNFEFDETGIKVQAADTSQVVYVHLKLYADRFEKFYCEKKLHVGLDMLKFNTLIKTISNNDVLTLFVEKSDYNTLGIHIENPNKHMKTTYRLNMLDIDALGYACPDTDFDCTITMPSVDLQKIIRDMNHLGEYIEIRNVENQLCLRCTGEFCTQETILSIDKSNDLIIEKNPDTYHKIIHGVYSLKYLVMFTKCTNLCQQVELYLKNDMPLVLSYKVASLGTIRFICGDRVEDCD